MKNIIFVSIVMIVWTRVYCHENSHNPTDRVLTKLELSEYDGTDTRRPILLAILGRVFDVTAGARHYGPGAPYAILTGLDGTRAFATGDFVGLGLTDDITGLDDGSLEGLADWLHFFESHERYSYYGRVEGRFFDSSGRALTDLPWKRLEKRKKEVSFPECNYRWGAKVGGFDDAGEVWCSLRSGGVDRTWVGVPRRMLHTTDGQSAGKCVCVPLSRAAGHASSQKGLLFEMYPGCSSDSERCRVTAV